MEQSPLVAIPSRAGGLAEEVPGMRCSMPYPVFCAAPALTDNAFAIYSVTSSRGCIPAVQEHRRRDGTNRAGNAKVSHAMEKGKTSRRGTTSSARLPASLGMTCNVDGQQEA